jgi:hypothetical protein
MFVLLIVSNSKYGESGTTTTAGGITDSGTKHKHFLQRQIKQLLKVCGSVQELFG